VNRGGVVELDVRLPGLATAAMIVATDASIQRGDSGGPLLDGSGGAVGVMLAHDTQETVASVGDRRSYAVLLRGDRDLRELLQEAEAPGFDPGFQPFYPRSDRAPFILVLNLDPEGLGAQWGLQNGDRIMSFDDEAVPDGEGDDAQRAQFVAFTKRPPGTTIQIGVRRPTEGGELEDLVIEVTVPQRAPVPAP